MCKPTRATVGALVAATILAILALAATAQRATAGQYHVFSCRTPNEQPAPVDGWTEATVPASTATVVAQDTCATGGALIAALADGVKHEVGSLATWSFAAPSGESVTRYTLWRAGSTEGGAGTNATYQFVFAGPTPYESFGQGECLYALGCKSVGEPSTPLGLVNLLAIPKANTGVQLFVTAACGGLPGYLCPEGKGDPNGLSAVVYLYAADIVLEDNTPPTVVPGSIAGELATAALLTGKANLIFSAEDAGAGVYQARLSVDGTSIGATALDSNGGRCVDVGGTTDGLPGFVYLQPCASVATSDVQLDTATLSNGVHNLAVTVQDAAGNSTVVLDRQIDVANATSSLSSGQDGLSSPGSGSGVGQPAGGGFAALGAANGSPAAAGALLAAKWASTDKASLVGRFGRRQTLTGRLTTAAGAPIAGALLEVLATPASQGAKVKLVASPRTDAMGRFVLRLPARSGSERIAVSYRAHLGDPAPAAVSALTLEVPASLALGVTPRRSHVGGTIRFAGALHGSPIPAGGKQVVLQARSQGQPWRTFKVISTDRNGRYRANYRFRLPGPAAYRFRATCPREADFPFARGESNVVGVRER